MKKIGNQGFALMEVLMITFIFLIFLTALFSTAGFRNRREVIRIKKLEASYASEAAMDLMISEVLKSGTCSLEEGIEPTETKLIFEPEDGSKEVVIPLTIWTERNERELCLYASVLVGNTDQTASAILYQESKQFPITASNAEITTYSNTDTDVWIIMEKYGI